jgi:hypothetical protein
VLAVSALFAVAVGCGSVAKSGGGTGGTGGSSGGAGGGGGAGGSSGGAGGSSGTPCVLGSSQVGNCVLQ